MGLDQLSLYFHHIALCLNVKNAAKFNLRLI